MDGDGHWQRLGEGAFGCVYKAIDQYDRKLAIKEINDVSDLREIRNHSKFEHPNIIQYRGWRRNGERIQIIMDRVDGGTLKSLVHTRGKLEEKQVVFYSKQILKGLEYLHGIHNIAHLDIKPDNILVHSWTQQVKISDFGISRRLRGIRVLHDVPVQGTEGYMAPEVYLGGKHSDWKPDRVIGKPADIWSFGCTVVWMATGEKPYTTLENSHRLLIKVK